jgi:superfamily II DNA/RNA helicase
MFDNYSFSLFNSLPSLPDLNIEETRRTLSKAYMYSIKLKLELVQQEFQSVRLEDLSEEEIEKIEEEINEESFSLFDELYHELRRLGDTLESSAIFDRYEEEIGSLISASFVAAEALSLLATLLNKEELDAKEEYLLSDELIYTRVEAAMLFLISGYDANAQTEIKKVESCLNNYQDYDDDLIKVEYWMLSNLSALLTNKLWSVKSEKPVLRENNTSKSLRNLILQNKVQMYLLIGESIVSYIDWIVGDKEDGLKISIDILTKIIESSYKSKYALYPEVFHFSKVLLAMIKETSKRSLLHNTPLPQNKNQEFISYLKGRVKGNGNISSRPFIWKSAHEFISECLPGPNKHVIINQPTGSGKSFIAELAAVHSLSTGWILYLAPTNALVHQIKKDLKMAFQFYGQVDIRTFVGGDEYTTLDDEFLEGIGDPNKFIAVMTPEKCAMSLRISPQIFQNCSLCIFDECHLLGEGNRGATVDLVLGQIMTINNNVKFMLMSAMLNNPKDLANWLENVTSSQTQISSISWKPTRSIRGAVGVMYNSYRETKEIAKTDLDVLPERRKNIGFEPSLSILYSLSGIWKDNYDDYSLMDTNIKSKYKLSRSKVLDTWIYNDEAESWVNSTSKSLGMELAVKGIPTIVFIPSNRHYPFTLARDVDFGQYTGNLTEYENNLLFLAEKELGLESEVKKFLFKGVGVHTAFMLDTEKEAVESLFKNQIIKLLFATGTLAQGLNLPSIAVVVAGTRVGDAREAHTPQALLRAKALILNAIGRAGRAGFSNQSLSLIVPNEPIIFKNEEKDIIDTINEIDVLKDKDASIRVRSPLEQFMVDILDGAIKEDRVSLEELTIMSMLSSKDVPEEREKSREILSKTYAASMMRKVINNEELTRVTNTISKIKDEFLEKAQVPKWSIEVARKAGFDFFTTNTFIRIIIDDIPAKDELMVWNIRDWKDFLFKSMEKLPPSFIRRLLPDNITQKPTFLNKMAQSIRDKDETAISWNKPEQWGSYWNEFSEVVWLYMQGESYAEIARCYLHIEGEVESTRTSGKPIPDILALVKRQVELISSYAGLLVAILEEILFKDEPIPFSLNVLPLAIKNGLKDHSTFYWYSYGFRNRVVAHLLGKAMPLDDFVNEDTSRRGVIQLKRSWLRNDVELQNLTDEEQKLLEVASMIIKNP